MVLQPHNPSEVIVRLPEPALPGPRTVPPIDDDDAHYYYYPSEDAVEEYIERGLIRLHKEVNDEEAVQRIIFQLITRSRLTTQVFAKLRGMYPRNLYL